jgi:hypothetical protein
MVGALKPRCGIKVILGRRAINRELWGLWSLKAIGWRGLENQRILA